MLYTGLRVGVVYADMWWAKSWFADFNAKYSDSVSKYIVSKSELAIILKDGTSIMAVKADDKARGHRFDKVFVQYGVSEDDIDEYIKPLMRIGIVYE